ncbi:adhesion G-protein coupled receptor G6-like [Oculina patagonica]
MPKLLGYWRHDSQAVQKCALAAEKARYSVFGVQNAGECWSGPQAHLTYKKYGSSTRCVNGIGGSWAQDVYTFVNASLIANYDIKRCYEVDITFHYQIPGGLTSKTIESTKSEFSDSFKSVSNLIKIVPQCSGVILTKNEITSSLPGVDSVFFKVPVIFTDSSSVHDDQVSSKLTNCINTAKSSYNGVIGNTAPTISKNGRTYSIFNSTTISDKRSCCGGDIPPPCCAAGSTKVSNKKCGCVPGFHFVPSSFCVRCPFDTYQEKQGQRSCKKCPGNKQTFGKTGMTSKSNCSDTNPLQLRDQTAYLPYDIKPGTVVTNVTVTGKLASLVQPFIFYIDNVKTPRQQSRGSLKRRRRYIADVCEEAGTIEPLNYFCIHRMSGQLKVTQDFVFKDGDEFDLKIRVTDSDQWGKTENTANFKFISRDDCKDIRTSYNKAVKFCTKDDPLEPVRASGDPSCPSAQCLEPLYNWQEKLNASEKLKADCSFDPHDMSAVMQKYSSCIGPPKVTLNPVSQTLKKDAPAVLTCNASSPLQVKITWFKNGKSMERYGSQLKIDSFQYEDQGDYYCSFSTYLTSSLSKPALLVLEDVFTSRVSFRIVNKKFKDDLLDPSSDSYSDMQIQIQRNLENYLNSGNPDWSYEVKLVQFRDSSGKVGVDVVIYSPAKSEDLTSYYSRLETLLADESAMGNTLKPLKVSRKSVTVRSATHCLKEKTGKESIMGVFDWSLTMIGQKSSPVKCPYGPPAANATRPCGGKFWTGGVWKNPDASSCKFKSKRTNQLNNLAKTPIGKQNVVKVTKEVKNLTSDPDDMNEADAVLIADVIENVVLLDDSLNETAQDVVDVIDNVMKMKTEDIQESQRSNKASTKFLLALDRVATKLPLAPNKSSRRLVAPSLAIQSNRVDPGSFTGMSLAIKPPAADPDKLTRDSMVNDELPMADVQTSITLPEVMFEKNTPAGNAVKIGFVIYQNDKFFQPVIPDDEESDQKAPSIMSRVISSSVQDMAFDNLTKPVELVFEPAVHEVKMDSAEFVCVFWDFSAMGGLGNWSDRGCRQMKNEAGRVQCHCDHMTNFAVLFSAGGPKTHGDNDNKHAMALSIISYVGCAISLVGLTLTLMTYALFRNLRKTNQQPILMSLCVALMLLLIVFIAGAARTENVIGCRIVAVLLHYFALATVMWMGVEGYNMYMSFVQVMATYQSKFMLKASAVAWGVPGVIVIITIASATSYYGNEDVCVLYGVPFQAAQFAPILLIILINFVIFILALRTINRTGAMVSAEKKSTQYHRARTAFAILLLLGLTWAFGALAVSRAQLVFDYLFCIFNSLQGFLIFYFHCIRHQEVRNLWKGLLIGKGLRVHKTETASRTGYPKTASRRNKYEPGTPSTSLSMQVPPGRKETVSSVVGSHSPTLKSRPDVVPAEV